MKKSESFDLVLAKQCAQAYADAVGIGTVISLADGAFVQSYGVYNCETCEVCGLAGKGRTVCAHAQRYGMSESQRFGGKYVYFCPMGLTCFTSPIIGSDGTEAKITAGPFLMVDLQDYLSEELLPQLSEGVGEEEARRALSAVPVITPERVENYSSLLFMAVGFMNNVWAANHLLEIQESYAIQKHISFYVESIKEEKSIPPYPLDLETKLLDHVAHLERDSANAALNELLGYIFFSMGGNLQLVKSRISELLVLISRTAMTNGADSQTMLMLTHDYLQIIPQISSKEELCSWLAKVMNRFMDFIFRYGDAKHANAIHHATQYIRSHYAEKISLKDVAMRVYLSPAYFSRIFRQETGETFNSYLNRVRVEQSKKLLAQKDIRLIDISLMTGFENQSYFTKVFKRVTGISPLQYRQKKCGDMERFQ